MTHNDGWESPLEHPILPDSDPDATESKPDNEEVPPPLKSDSVMRWPVLLLGCVAMIGNYYCFDNPAALKTSLEEYVGLTETQYNLLYTVYSIPNIILPFFGGYLCDMLGAARALSIFAATLVVGQCIFAFGVSIKSVGFMYLGRVVYGLGGENMAVGSSVVLAEWFQNKEMAFAMALQVAVSRIGSVVNNVLSPAIADSTNVPTALWFGALVCGGSLGCTLLLYPIDVAGELRVKEARKERRALQAAEATASGGGGGHLLGAAADNDAADDDAADVKGNGEFNRGRSLSSVGLLKKDTNPLAGCADVKKFGLPFWLLASCCVVVYACVIPFNSVASSVFLERDYFKEQPGSKCALTFPDECQSELNPPNEFCKTDFNWKPPLPDFIKQSKVSCTDKKWKKARTGEKCARHYCHHEIESEKTVAVLFSIPFFISAFASPFLGGYVDLVGGRGYICVLSALMLVGVHALLGYSSVTPYALMTGQGIAYSMFAAALWPSVPYLVPEKSVGIAYGVVTAVQNAGLAGVPLLISIVYEASGGYYIPKVELLFTIFALCGTACAIALNVVAPYLNWKDPPPFPDPDAPAAGASALVGDGDDARLSAGSRGFSLKNQNDAYGPISAAIREEF